MINVILFGVLACILVAAAVYVYKAKRRGQKCIGCPSGCSCGKGKEASCKSGGAVFR